MSRDKMPLHFLYELILFSQCYLTITYTKKEITFTTPTAHMSEHVSEGLTPKQSALARQTVN